MQSIIATGKIIITKSIPYNTNLVIYCIMDTTYDKIVNSNKFENRQYKIAVDKATEPDKAGLIIATRSSKTAVPEEIMECCDTDFLITPCNEGQPLNYGEHIKNIAPAMERLLSLMFKLQEILTKGTFTTGQLEFTDKSGEYVTWMIYYNGKSFEFQKL